ncbi:TetR/AcrR family transcriptional regulator [Companilactobacillus futsaii]|uniref:TetR/AcrR family transcriptional regulator n=2 Tax=Companilactobacillus futsaii TaxID=938155 RepID=A0A5B7SYR3_9LACO|nr:TetR/AcrR family transcriptional regulator [Companilactobacillus futsaii]KRK91056.1 TetR family transcriptional regulator [Companilactobacillus futsaii JCM 17355]QCX24778.1 TetR/AcrR family transcriptional regulator [Companilactobacillus futsaii]
MEQAFEDLNDWLMTSDMPFGKKQVLKAAIELFSKQGYDGTSTSQIAEASGMSQATIFKYYKSKEDLLLVILEPLIDHLLPTYGKEFAQKLSQQDQNLASMIHFIVSDRYHFLVQNKDAVMILISQLLINQQIKNKVLQKIAEVKDIFEQNIWLPLQATNELRDDLDELGFLRLVVSQIIFYFIQTQRISTADEATIQTGLEQIEVSILRAIEK